MFLCLKKGETISSLLKRLLNFPGCHSYINKRKAGKYFSSLPRISPIKSHFSGISHAQTQSMATRINLLLFDQVARSSEYPLVRNSDKCYSNVQNPSRLAYNEFVN